MSERKGQNKHLTAAQRKGQRFLTPVDNDSIRELITTSTSIASTVHMSSDTFTHASDCNYKLQEGDNVLLLVDERSVARGQVLRGRCMHGRDVPAELTVVSIKEVWDKSCPLQFYSPFDEQDDVLISGMITGWPTRLLQKL